MLSLIGLVRYYAFIIGGSMMDQRVPKISDSDSLDAQPPRSRSVSHASNTTSNSQKELFDGRKGRQFVHKVSSRALVLIVAAHFIVLVADICLLTTTDSSEWTPEHIQMYGLFSLLVFFTNICVPLLVTVVLLKHNQTLNIFASVCVIWISVGFVVAILAWGEFADLRHDHPAFVLTLTTLVLMILDALLLAVFNFSRSECRKARHCPSFICL